MEEASKDVESKLYCPTCSTRVGSLNWVGVQIPGGGWVSPAIIIHRKAVDPRAAVRPADDEGAASAAAAAAAPAEGGADEAAAGGEKGEEAAPAADDAAGAEA